MINLNENEKIIVTLRRYWVVISIKISLIIAIAAIPFIIYPFIKSFLPGLTVYPKIGLILLLALIYYMFLWLYFFLVWTDYYLDVWIVTNKRVIDIEQKGLFSREVSEFSISRIQDITVEVTGIFPTLFHYGNIHIQTAGESRQFIFKDIKNPYKEKDRIMRLQHIT